MAEVASKGDEDIWDFLIREELSSEAACVGQLEEILSRLLAPPALTPPQSSNPRPATVAAPPAGAAEQSRGEEDRVRQMSGATAAKGFKTARQWQQRSSKQAQQEPVEEEKEMEGCRQEVGHASQAGWEPASEQQERLSSAPLLKKKRRRRPKQQQLEQREQDEAGKEEMDGQGRGQDAGYASQASEPASEQQAQLLSPPSVKKKRRRRSKQQQQQQEEEQQEADKVEKEGEGERQEAGHDPQAGLKPAMEPQERLLLPQSAKKPRRRRAKQQQQEADKVQKEGENVRQEAGQASQGGSGPASEQQQQQQQQEMKRQQQQQERVDGPGSASSPRSPPRRSFQKIEEDNRRTSLSDAAAHQVVGPHPVAPDENADAVELSHLLSLLGIEADRLQTNSGTTLHWQQGTAGHPQQLQEPPYGEWWQQQQQQGHVVPQPFDSQAGLVREESPAPPTPDAPWPITTLTAAALQGVPPVMAATEALEDPAPQPEDDSCVVCMEGPKESVLVPCGHQALCKACTLGLFGSERGGERVCPICMGAVAQYLLQVFRC